MSDSDSDSSSSSLSSTTQDAARTVVNDAYIVYGSTDALKVRHVVGKHDWEYFVSTTFSPTTPGYALIPRTTITCMQYDSRWKNWVMPERLDRIVGSRRRRLPTEICYDVAQNMVARACSSSCVSRMLSLI